MAVWTKDELDKIEKAEELEIAALRKDDTLRKFVTIWAVRVGDDIYVRSARGPAGGWYRGVRARREGRIKAGGVDKAVAFADETDADINNQIDAAYRAKYTRYPQYVAPMVVPEIKATTIKIVPR